MRRKNLDFVVDANGCFVTTSHVLNKDGYYYFWKNKKGYRAHRAIYEACFGDIPEGLVVRHKCDVRNCINPEHMELGTNTENTRDCIERGRKAVGEKSNRNTITEEKAKEIKIMMEKGLRNYEIARTLNISIYIVRSIRNLKTWKHVDIG